MRPLTCVRPAGAGRPWVFLPFAGGSGDWYRSWARWLSPEDGVWVANLPGRSRRPTDPALVDPEAVVRELTAAVHALPSPPVLFGHSLGAFLAHAVAGSLESSGRPVRLVVVSGAGPSTGGRTRPCDELDDAALVAYLADLGGTPPEVLAHPELLELVLPGLRADLRLAAAFGEPRLVRAPVLALAGVRDATARPEEVASWAPRCERWQGLRVFDGGHFFLDDHAPQVVGAVHDVLALTDETAPHHAREAR
jgi:medium-chain acyl-[acyl-carrier-protein] hydrolase